MTNTDLERELKQWDKLLWKLAGSVAMKITHGDANEQLVDELHAAAMAGFVKARDKFDPSRGFKFITMAHWWARHEISEYLRTRHAMGPTFGRSENAGAGPRLISLDSELPDRIEDTTLTYAELTGHCNRIRFRQRQHSTRNSVRARDWPDEKWESLLRHVRKEDRRCWWLRYHDGLTLREIGEQVKLTRERVRQKCVRACDDLRSVKWLEAERSGCE